MNAKVGSSLVVWCHGALGGLLRRYLRCKMLIVSGDSSRALKVFRINGDVWYVPVRLMPLTCNTTT